MTNLCNDVNLHHRYLVPQILTDARGNAFELRPATCPICGPSATTCLGLRGGRHHRYGYGIESRVVRCMGCGLLFPDPFPLPLDTERLYGDPAAYFASHDSAAKITVMRAMWRQALARISVPEPKLLDIGCGQGELLEAARLEGIAGAVGLDISPAMVDQAKALYGADARVQTAEAHAVEAPGTYDIIALTSLIEHVHDPDALIAAVSAMAHSGTLIYIELPAEPSLMTLVGNAWNKLRGDPAVYNLSPTWVPYHVYGFNPPSLRRLLVKHGLRLTSLVRWADPVVPSHGPFADRLKAWIATQINRLANRLGLAHCMVVWATKD